MALTKLTIDSLQPRGDGKPLKVADGLGLSIWVMPNGSKYWRMKYRFDGKEKSLSIGVYPEVSLKDARLKRDEARRLLAEDIDPNEQRKDKRRARLVADAGVFEKVAMEWHRVKAAEWAPRHAVAVLRSLQRYILPDLGKRPVTEITPMEVVSTLRKVEATGNLDTARRLRGRVSAIFRLAVVTGLTKLNPAADLVEVLIPPVSKPQPALSKEELPKFIQYLDNAQGITLQTKYLILVVMTCFTRIGETVRAEWEHLDLDAGVWTIPPENRKLKHKLKAMANPHIVPLPGQIVEIFRTLESCKTDGNPYVFPGFRRPGTHMNEATPLKAYERMGYGGKNTSNGHLVTHGFRSTASTILNEAGFNPDAIERQLSHTEGNKVRAAYNRAQYMEERRQMLQAWADHLDKISTLGYAGLLHTVRN